MRLFTHNQRKALIFLIIILTLSVIIQWLSPHRLRQPLYDYSASDSIFKHISQDSVYIRPSYDIEISMKNKVGDTVKKLKTSSPQNPDYKSIRINVADKELLQKLPRIGPRMAERIIEFRSRNGPFKKAEDLLRVKGIGEKTLAKILPYITLD